MKSSEKPEKSIADPFEDVAWVPARTILMRQGFEPESPKALDDLQIPGRLWELIYAMAARGFYLACTDHLSDRDLLCWLHEHWLDEEAADLPAGTEWSARISPVSSVSEEEGTSIWLRYYADEAERQQFADVMLPPHEDPKYDRDRLLPDSPAPSGSLCEGTTGFEDLGDDGAPCFGDSDVIDDNDLLGLDAVDAAIRADRELREIEAMDFEVDDVPLKEEWQQPLRLLQRQGVTLLPPDEHTDETIGAGLWELLHELASRGFYVLHTDHLTDRELYSALWKDSLRERAVMPGRSLTTAWYHDIIGSGSDADEQLHLRYYATEKERTKAQLDNPGRSLPVRERPVARRDWRLPQGPV